MRAGTLRHRLTIQERDESTRTGSGEITPSWVDVKTVWAEIKPADGTEAYNALGDVDRTEQPVMIRLRYRSGITPKHRLLRAKTGVVYDIRAITNTDERKKELTLVAVVHG